ncbi:probable histone-lysine N-methyltransferase set-23 [Toxorhynchites rutilus septentrionalis]|uniref:probable histone-lysine N-methyltransferase set-23 n=1 Tax=Toxorhynchites rutilus septentrionalis TaxID=329112 RepID=UPI0024794901|nr:probable histone-lysine N-methyltransferase set-23 [Toxorhynchites rutilus septentrionalis]
MSSVRELKDPFGRGSGIVKIYGERHLLEMEDDYQHPDEELEYLIENQLQDDDGSESFRKLKHLVNHVYGPHCNCDKNKCCTTKSESCLLGGNYEPNGAELVVRDNLEVIFECVEACRCTALCWNRLMQYGPRKQLAIRPSLNIPNQLGLFTRLAIPKGGFVCEYAGEILTRAEAEKRNRLNDPSGQNNYVLCLNEILPTQNTKIQTFIDPEKRGNIGRYLNHSCDPNCRTVSVHIEGPPARIGIFAQRDVLPEEELFFDYGGGRPDPSIGSVKCFCGSSNCRGNLPSLRY